jgi:hypothetical protein
MDTSILLARLFGITMIVVYSSLLINRTFFKRIWQELPQQPLLLFLSGFIALILGLLVIQVHNVWTADWKGIITLLGWAMIFQGIMRILFPETVLSLAKKMFESKYLAFIDIIAALLLIVGLYLTYIGYFL